MKKDTQHPARLDGWNLRWLEEQKKEAAQLREIVVTLGDASNGNESLVIEAIRIINLLGEDAATTELEEQRIRDHIIVGAIPPATEAGRLWHEEWHSEEGGGPDRCGTAGCGFLGRILAIEAEARAALLAELEAGVEGLPVMHNDREAVTFMDASGDYLDRAAVLDLIRKAGKP